MARGRVRGLPPSANGASSFHLWWAVEAAADRVEVTLEVLDPPAVDRLYFWALQVGFQGPAGKSGGAHLGLQWNRRHPGSTAVNWGGYTIDGRLLEGSGSPLPSAPGDPNTRDFPWRAGVPYRLRVEPGLLPGWWRGVVVDLADGAETTVRELAGGGDRLADAVVWSEVFARCDDPSVSVRWSDPRLAGDAGWVRPAAYRVNYQAHARGGCANTDVQVDARGVLQVTAVTRHTPQDALVPVP